MADQSDEAPTRNDLAEDRTILANERTFASWTRTSMGSIGIGIGLAALFSRMQPSWVPRAIATAFLGLAIVIMVSATWRSTSVMAKIAPHLIIKARTVNLRLIAGVITGCTIALIGSIWLLRFN